MTAEYHDAIVIGSGAGGSATAWQLARAGLRVLLLEKGDPLPRDGSTLDPTRVVRDGAFLAREPWSDGRGGNLVPEEHYNLGGKTKWYGAALFRFPEVEFQPDPSLHLRGWPITPADLAPYYAQAEQLLGVRDFAVEADLQRVVARLTAGSSPWSVRPVPLALDAAIAQDPIEASHFDGFASVAGHKGEAESRLLMRLPGSAALRIETGAEVTELLADPLDSRRVGGVKLADGRTFLARETVLAAGALHSPRLLGRYFVRHGLTSQLPAAAHVGRHLKLHLLTAMIAVSQGRKTDLLRKTCVLTHPDFPHSSVQPLGFDAGLIAGLMPRMLPGAIATALAERAYGYFLQTEEGSHPENAVHERLLPTGPERVMDYDERRLPDALREHRAFARALQRDLLRSGCLAFTRRIGLSGTAHACGTLVMGTSGQDSVVAADGRVHGMRGLAVADGSVLPRISSVNPALTIYAWGLRVGALLSGAGPRADAHATGTAITSPTEFA